MVTMVYMVFLVVELKNSLQLFSIMPLIGGISLAVALSLGLGDHV